MDGDTCQLRAQVYMEEHREVLVLVLFIINPATRTTEGKWSHIFTEKSGEGRKE